MTTELSSADVPQEDDLAKVRLVLGAVALGLQDTQSIAEKSGVSRRHVGYAINASIVLGWLAEGDEQLVVSPAGTAVLAQPQGSPEERAMLRAAVVGSKVLQQLAPDLLAEAEPSREAIAERIRQASGLSASTAERRTRALISWRRQVLAKPPAAGG